MSLTYFKRSRMEVDLKRRPLVIPELPDGYRLVGWNAERADDMIRLHAEAKFHSFRNELDSSLFPCLGTADGCRELMGEIAERSAFLPEATWLVEYLTPTGRREVCGTIQGMIASPRFGAIQNVGVTPFHRGRGLASALVTACLAGFQQAGLPRAYLEVTVQNEAAVKLYARLGFFHRKSLYKAVELVYT